MSAHKIVVMGGQSVGKSALAIMFVWNHFAEDFDPNVEDTYRKSCIIEDEPCLLEILDTASQNDYSPMRSRLIRSADGILLIYSVDSRKSFEDLITYRDHIVCADAEQDLLKKPMPLVVVGNKCDLEDYREVAKTEGMALASKFGVRFFETSARRRVNVEESIHQLVKEIREQAKVNVLKNKKKKIGQKRKCSLM
eukprot:TRINITY_DN18856_c0_g1_i1.p1 TRINITY_DN18856_c0_g1~~TRINITY_DN18856_c0_g1_i1.p1  ORF type:complete len:195 (+),score=36.47 TRINITY_DN18856_c0_g1_i1:41-625(+)